MPHCYFNWLGWPMHIHNNFIPNSHWYVNKRLKNYRLSTKIYFICPYVLLNNPLQWHAFALAPVHSSKPTKVPQEETPTTLFMKFSLPLKLSNSEPSRVRGGLRGEVLNSSPIIRRQKQKAKRMKNNLKEIFRNPNSSKCEKMMTVTAVKSVRNATV